MKIKNKQDVISWLKDLKENHPLSTSETRTVITTNNEPVFVKVYTDQIIKKRYSSMIDFLESDEVE